MATTIIEAPPSLLSTLTAVAFTYRFVLCVFSPYRYADILCASSMSTRSQCAFCSVSLMLIQTSGRNCDFELKNGSGFWGRGLIAGARYEHTTYQIFVSGSVWPIIDKSHICKELQKFAVKLWLFLSMKSRYLS